MYKGKCRLKCEDGVQYCSQCMCAPEVLESDNFFPFRVLALLYCNVKHKYCK